MKKLLKLHVLFLILSGLLAFLWSAQPLPTNNQTLINGPGDTLVNSFTEIKSPLQNHNLLYPIIRDTTELYWDDGVPEGYNVVCFPPTANDRMAVRFDIPGPLPMKVTGGRVYTDNEVIPLKSFSVCRDAGGYPDVFHPIDQINTVHGGNPGWGNVTFQGAIFDSSDIWAVVSWIPGYVVGIGADSTAPDGNSYWCLQREAVNWTLETATDWMMRLSVATVTDSHDVTAISILEPPGRFTPGDTAHPTAVLGNCGLSPETFNVTFEIRDSVGSVVYTSANSITLASCEVETLTFIPDWIEVQEGMYTYRAYTSLAGDADPANDTIYMQGLCTREIVITYVGDYTNMSYSIVGSWASNRKFLMRMTPPVSPPFYIRRAQVFLANGNAPLEYVCVCPDNGSGLPDTAVIFAIANDVMTSQDWTWATANFGEIEVTQPGDLWVIAKWPEGITEPHIGAEYNVPSTERAWRYYFKDGAGHMENMGVPPYYREWYFRLIIAVPPLVGVQEKKIAVSSLDFGVNIKPNPSKGFLSFFYSLPKSAEVELNIYDVTGRLVYCFNKGIQATGSYCTTWNGKDNHGTNLASGLYFAKFTAGDYKETKKLLLLK